MRLWGASHGFLVRQFIDGFPDVPREAEPAFVALLGKVHTTWLSFVIASTGEPASSDLPPPSYYADVLGALWAERAGDELRAIPYAKRFAAAIASRGRSVTNAFVPLVGAARLLPLLRRHGEAEAVTAITKALRASHHIAPAIFASSMFVGVADNVMG